MTSTPTRFDLSGLPDAERLLLAGELLDMAQERRAPLTASQLAAMEQRDAEADAGTVEATSWESVRDRFKPNR